MKRMQWIVAAGALAMAASAGAQSRTAPNVARPNAMRPNAVRPVRPNAAGPMLRHPILAILARLDLTQEQKDKIKAVVQAAEQQVRPIRLDPNLTPQQKRERLQPIMKSVHEQILAILTPEQRQKAMAMLRRERPGLFGMAVLEKLGLSADQKTQIRNILSDAQAKGQAIRQSSLSEQEKRTKMRELNMATRRAVMQVLTPEQRAKLEGMRQNRP